MLTPRSGALLAPVSAIEHVYHGRERRKVEERGEKRRRSVHWRGRGQGNHATTMPEE